MEIKPLHPGELKKFVADCFAPKPWIYWTDFLTSVLIGYGAFLLAEMLPLHSWWQPPLYFVCLFALYRGALFIHELTHQERKDLPGFSVVFNLLIGIPFLLPSFMYRSVHIDHHKKTSYGTSEDGEYLPLGVQPFWKTLAYVCQSFYLPVLVILRFGILAPLSMLSPRLRILVMERASSLAIQPNAVRKIPGGIDMRNWIVLEALCFGYVILLASLFATSALSAGTLWHMYVVFVGISIVNSVRTVVAHRYRNKSLQEMHFQDQLLDSVNIGGNALIAELTAPVGLRYHALHHLFPTIPYHALHEVHRRLMAHLPADSMYHQMTEPSLWSALVTHWKNTHSAETAQEATSART